MNLMTDATVPFDKMAKSRRYGKEKFEKTQGFYKVNCRIEFTFMSVIGSFYEKSFSNNKK